MPAELSDEADAYLLLERLRWGGAPDQCPHCAVRGRCYFLRPADGRSRATRTGTRSQRRVWKCGACRRQFSALTGTVLEGTKVDVQIWVAVVADLTHDRRSTSSSVADRYGLSPEAARHLLDRLRASLDRIGQPRRSDG